MKKILTFLIINILIFSAAKAEIINEIIIAGNKRVSDETVKVYGEIKPIGSNILAADTDLILKNLYSTNFFEEIDVELKNNKLIINLKEYPLVNEIVLLGEPSKRIKQQIIKIMKLKTKGSFIKNYLNSDVNTIKKLYASIGYNFSEVEVKVRKIDENNFDLAIEIDRGDRTKISKIFFTGDKKVKQKRLRDIITSEEDKFWKFISNNTNFSENQIELDQRLLVNYYKSIGYYDVVVSSSSAEILDSKNINLFYSIDAGIRYRINKIETVVDSTFDKKIFFPLEKNYAKIVGDFYSPFKIKKILEELDNLIDKNSLQFVEHNVNEIIEGDQINLKFNIVEGKKILVERIDIKGNNVTNENVIRGELLLDEGDPFTQLSLDKSISNLKSRGIFKTVKKETLSGSNEGLKVINIMVEEKPTGEISAGAGIGTNGGSFAVDIKENNWLGEGKKIGLNFEASQDSLKGQFTYSDPNYDLLGNQIEYSLYNITNDKPDQGYENNVIAANISTGFEQYKNLFTSFGLGLSYDDLRTNTTASDSLKKQSGEYSELAFSYGLSYDQRDRKFMPTDGSIIGFNQVLPVYADKPYISNTFSTSNYHTFNESLIGSGKIYLTSINGLNDEDVRISKRKNLSSRRLRGFEKGKVGPVDGTDHIGGNYAAALNFEATLPNVLPESTNTDISAFLDFGSVWGVDYDKTIDESNKLRSSTGVAASWISPIGPLTFILSTNLSKAKTDKTESFNFNLGTTF
jgi:outer membrane protein insertion porin family